MPIESIQLFSEVEEFLKEYLPITPYGLMNKHRAQLFYDLDELHKEHISIEKAVAFLRESPYEADKIGYLLRNIGEICSLDVPSLDNTEIFLIKRFLVSYKAITGLLSENVRQDLDIEFSLQDLLDLLATRRK